MDNPDQRIQEDGRDFVASALGLSLSLMAAVATLVSFGGLLWTLSAGFPLQLGATELRIPGFTLWVAVAYGLLSMLGDFDPTSSAITSSPRESAMDSAPCETEEEHGEALSEVRRGQNDLQDESLCMHHHLNRPYAGRRAPRRRCVAPSAACGGPRPQRGGGPVGRRRAAGR